MDTTTINGLLLTLAPGIIVPIIITLCFHLYNLLEARLPNSLKEFVNQSAYTVVHAVEQQYSGLSSAQKKSMALKLLSSILVSVGLKDVDVSLLSTEIEAAVKQMNMNGLLYSSPASIEPTPATQVPLQGAMVPNTSVPSVPHDQQHINVQEDKH